MPSRSFPIDRSSRRGIMLLIVTLVLTALTLSGAALLTLMKTEREATMTRGRESLVKGVDRSAVVFLIGTLENTREDQAKMGGLYDNPDYFCASQLLTLDEGGDDSSRFTIVSPKFTDAKIEGLRYGLTDESSRLNLEAVLAWEEESPGAGRKALMSLPGMTATAADSILDWIDPDEKARPYGAEAKFYADKKAPYSPRNAVPVFLEELLLARGVSRAQLYGADENFTYGVDKLDASKSSGLGGSLTTIPSSANEREGEASVPWKELATVFSAEKDVDPQGSARVDLNGDDLQFLYGEASARVGDELARFIVLYRQYGPDVDDEENAASSTRPRSGRRSGYLSPAAAANESASDATKGTLASASLDLSVAPTTTLKTPLDLVGARVRVGNVYYESPIADSLSKENADKLFALLDYCSTSASTTIVGRVNVNVAPRVVLSAIPDLETADVQKIIDERPDPAQDLPSDYRHASWLYTKGLVSLEKMKGLYGKTTARGDVYRGQIVGFLDGSNEISRAEVVVDGTTEPPRQVFYKDLTTMGKGFDDAVLYGGSTASRNAASAGGTEADWNAVQRQTQIVEFVDSNGAGYGNKSANDPFAAVELATGATTQSAAIPNALGATTQSAAVPNALGGETTTSALPNAVATPEDASGAANASSAAQPSENASQTASDASDASGTTEADGADEPSRKEQLLNALRTMREARQTRYEQ